MSFSTTANRLVDCPPYAQASLYQDITTLNWIFSVKVTALIHIKHTRKTQYTPHQVGTITSLSDEPNASTIQHLLDISLSKCRTYLDAGSFDETKYDLKTDSIVKTGKKIYYNDWLLTDKDYNVLERKT